MNTLTRALCASIMFLAVSSVHALAAEETCVNGNAKTVDEAFSLGVELAKKSRFELGDGEKKAHIHILPDKKHGLYIVKVCPSSYKEDNTGT